MVPTWKHALVRHVPALEDARAYVRCMAQGVTPSVHHHDAWERFFLEYSRRIHFAAQNCGLSAADAEDCTQEVWLVILDVLRRPDHEPWRDQFSRWMRGVIRNQVAYFVRRMARRSGWEVELLENATFGQDSDPVANSERSDQRRLVRHALTDLKRQVSPTNYRVAHLRWIEGCEVAEVAAQLDLTSEQVRYRHHRVKKRFRRLLEYHGGRPE